jgi:hypothetical protein
MSQSPEFIRLTRRLLRSPSTSLLKPFKYTPFLTDIDTIRLVTIKPGWSSTQIHCSLVHAAFGGKPKYEALSYMWGAQDERKEIVIDGKGFHVHKNLWVALYYLRSQKEERTFWIDAICIDPMTVVIWLGDLELGADNTQEVKAVEVMDATISEQLLWQLCQSPYWQRVWIIQELGKARRIKVQFAHNSLSWESFIGSISYITKNSKRKYMLNSKPMQIADQLADKYGRSHRLRNLLEKHQDSLCQNPHDKIYGFVGLATDCFGNFPIDYSKPLEEVYMDTMLFQKNIPSADPHEILPFAQLVRRLLGGENDVQPPDRFLPKNIRTSKLPEQEKHTNTDQSSPPKGNVTDENPNFEIPARLSGRIEHIGPTYNEMMSQVRKSDEWNSTLGSILSEQYFEAASEESEYFLEMLDESNDADRAIVTPFDPPLSWMLKPVKARDDEEDEFQDVDSEMDYGYEAEDDARFPTSITIMDDFNREGYGPPADYNKRPGKEEGDMVEQWHFLMRRHAYGKAVPTMGLVPSNACIGDFVCELNGVSSVAIMRKNNVALDLIGAGCLALDVVTARQRRRKDQDIPDGVVATSRVSPSNSGKGGRGQGKFGIPSFKEVDEVERIWLHLDVKTLHQLSN